MRGLGWARHGITSHFTTLAGQPASTPLLQKIKDFSAAVTERGVEAGAVANVILSLFIPAAHTGSLRASEVDAFKEFLDTPQAKAQIDENAAAQYRRTADGYYNSSGETVAERAKNIAARPELWR